MGADANREAPESKQFWDATAQEKLLVKRCRNCEETHHYPRASCPHCYSNDLEWIESRGLGRIYSFSTLRRATPPYTIAYVALDEGCTLLTNIIDCDPDDLAVDQKVRLAFAIADGDVRMPVFKPVEP